MQIRALKVFNFGETFYMMFIEVRWTPMNPIHAKNILLQFVLGSVIFWHRLTGLLSVFVVSSGFSAAAGAAVNAVPDGIVVRLWHSVAITNFTLSLLLTAVLRLLHWCLQSPAAATAAPAVPAPAAVWAGVSGMSSALWSHRSNILNYALPGFY